MIHYKLYQNNNDRSSGYGLWYARVATSETVGLEKLAGHMAAHNTPYSQGCIYGVLRDMVICIKELVIDGKAVKLDDLAIFSASIRSKGCATAADYNSAQHIKNIHLNARATGKLRTAVLTYEASKKQLAKYSVDKSGGSKTVSAAEGEA